MYAQKRLRQSNNVVLRQGLPLGDFLLVEAIFCVARMVLAVRNIQAYPYRHWILKTISGLETMMAFNYLEKSDYVC